ncbi:MAG TPA: 6-phosphogluconolactonase [Gemmatimonadales bacterium]|nr:6-phosphogluconolactonase [Gemmatimonadales bacterium]
MSAVRVVRDAADLARTAAEHVAARAAEAIAARGRCNLVLAGGETPRAAYGLLASEAFAGRVDWGRVQFFWGDERCVPPDDPRSNYRTAREALLDRVRVPSENVHRIRGEDDPTGAAAAYDRLLRDMPGRFDLVLLGMGADGHTASLFPGHAAVRERVRLALAERMEPVDMWRVTLTPPAFNAARDVLFLVAGAGKAETLARVLEAPREPELLPAQSIAPAQGELTWLVDAQAAARLAQTARG